MKQGQVEGQVGQKQIEQKQVEWSVLVCTPPTWLIRFSTAEVKLAHYSLESQQK